MTRKSASGRTLLALTYDRNGNKISQADVTGKVTEYAYSPLDLLERVWDDGKELAAYTYNPDGTPKAVTHGPIRQEYAYDLDKNLTGLTVRSGDALLARNSYTYDGNGNRTLKRQLGGETLYHYDPLNQLNKVEYPSYTEELFYDRAGNRTRRLVAGEEELYRYDPRNRLMAYTKNGVTTMFQYDNAGNLLVDDKAQYGYDAFNRTVKVETFDGNVQVNRYDAEGLRYEMEENGNLVQFIFNQEREVVTEEDSTGLTHLIRSTELIARSSESARTYYHYASDEMGSTTHIVDENGNVQNRYEYDAWGNFTAQEEIVPNRFTYYGQQIDPITQQYYLRARFYNPVIGRFTQEDTYRGDGLNLYAYCANNPVCYVDPSGYACKKDLFEFPDLHYVGSKLKDLDWRNTGYSYQDAINEAFRRVEEIDPFFKRGDFVVTRWARDLNGKSIPVEFMAPSGSIVDIDIAHIDARFNWTGTWETGPDAPHIGWTAYDSSGKRTTGHIILNDVPTGRDYAYSNINDTISKYKNIVRDYKLEGLTDTQIIDELRSNGVQQWMIDFVMFKK